MSKKLRSQKTKAMREPMPARALRTSSEVACDELYDASTASTLLSAFLYFVMIQQNVPRCFVRSSGGFIYTCSIG